MYNLLIIVIQDWPEHFFICFWNAEELVAMPTSLDKYNNTLWYSLTHGINFQFPSFACDLKIEKGKP